MICVVHLPVHDTTSHASTYRGKKYDTCVSLKAEIIPYLMVRPVVVVSHGVISNDCLPEAVVGQIRDGVASEHLDENFGILDDLVLGARTVRYECEIENTGMPYMGYEIGWVCMRLTMRSNNALHSTPRSRPARMGRDISNGI